MNVWADYGPFQQVKSTNIGNNGKCAKCAGSLPTKVSQCNHLELVLAHTPHEMAKYLCSTGLVVLSSEQQLSRGDNETRGWGLGPQSIGTTCYNLQASFPIAIRVGARGDRICSCWAVRYGPTSEVIRCTAQTPRCVVHGESQSARCFLARCS
jgi:hypothetical protein